MKYDIDFDRILIDELIEIRSQSRIDRDWKFSDEIRTYLDSKNVFIFDEKWGQEVHHLNDDYFYHIYKYEIKKDGVVIRIDTERHIDKIERLYHIKFQSKRKFVEWNIQQDIRAEKTFDAWLYSMNESIK
jgi:hypothetical protein